MDNLDSENEERSVISNKKSEGQATSKNVSYGDNDDDSEGRISESDLEKLIIEGIKREKLTKGRSRQVLTCLHCGRTHFKLSNMKDHVRTHLLIKNYKCGACGTKFGWKGNRDRHVRIKKCENRLLR